MRYGVFSDVHSNLEALEAVLAFFEDMEVDGYICCGDLVGYGPQPDECLQRIRKLKNLSLICGNHDLAVIGRIDVDWFNAYAKAAALWTREVLSDDSKNFLQSLTARLDCPEFTLVHGTPRRPPEEYLMSAAQFRDNIEYVSVWPLFIGHSHMPVVFRQVDGAIDQQFLDSHQEIELPREAGGKFLPAALNPGSVGQPRDHDRRASCGVFDATAGTYRVVRLEYDVPSVQAKIREAGLPEYLALRLAFGQ